MKGCSYGKILHNLKIFERVDGIVKIEVMQIKRDSSPKFFHLRNDKADLKGL